MAQEILTLFVYLFAIILIVTLIQLSVALIQLIKDMPAIRRRIWKVYSRRFKEMQNAHS